MYDLHRSSIPTEPPPPPPRNVRICCPDLHDVDLSIENVFKHVTLLANKTSAGPDEYPQSFIRKLAPSITEPLSIIFRLSVNSAELPSIWSISKIIPIHKKKSVNKVENYRPISLLCVTSKILESIIRENLVTHLLANSIISDAQHGFRNKRSTVTQLLVTIDKWTKSLDEGYAIDAIYLDISKAFDSVSHSKLLKKLECIGIRGKLLKWFKAYLANRRQFVVVENCHSPYGFITSGIAQGSLLGPLLFIVFLNDLVDVIRNSDIKMYADDAKLFREVQRNTENVLLQEDLQRTFNWLSTMQLKLSVDNFNVVHFGYGNVNTEFATGDIHIPSESTVVDLGVTVSSDLKFSKHCQRIATNGFRAVNLLYKVFLSRDRKFLVNMYKTYVRSKLEYASEVWSPYLLADINLLERVQKLFTRRIPGLENVSYAERLRILNLDTLEKRRVIKDLVMVYKIVNGLVDLNFSDMFTFSSVNVTRGHCFKLFKNPVRLDVRKYCFSQRVIPMWNSLSNDIVCSSSIFIFKKKLKTVNLDEFLRVEP